jgi:hypothetical protein
MMPDVKPNALMPKGEANGFAAIADELIKNPNQLRAALIIFDAKRGTEDYDLHDTIVTVRIRRGEMVLPQDLSAVEQMIRRALEFRSGQTTLELELEDEIRQAFDSMKDPDSTADPDEDEPGEGGEGRKRPRK